MGIIKDTLTDVNLSEDKHVRIEDNVSGKIHIHINDFRIEMTKEEFKTFRQTVLDGRDQLEDLKDGL